jgi:hypothetical protein
VGDSYRSWTNLLHVVDEFSMTQGFVDFQCSQWACFHAPLGRILILNFPKSNQALILHGK